MSRRTMRDFATALVLLTNASSVFAAWDALPVQDNYYPNNSWEQRFAAQPDVIATGNIDNAIYSCDDIVGVNGFCVVQIADTATRRPIYLDRSRTKLVGFEGMKPLASKNNESVISVESNTRYTVLENLELQGHNANRQEVFGIVVAGENINGVVIRDNHIHDFTSRENAHAIAVYGSGGAVNKSIRNVLIENNNVHDMQTGSSESIVVNGNVIRWAIVGNTVKDVNNIAIDAIGGEGTAPTRVHASGRIVPGLRDRARLGFILNNHVENMSTLGNPAYGNKHSWAAGIYVDGGSRIMIEGNTVINTPWAYDIGAENCLTTSHITVVNNSASGSRYGDLLLGGYSEVGYPRDSSIDCNPLTSFDSSEGHGYVARIRTGGNSFHSTGTLEDKILPQFRLRGAVILDPGVEAVNTHRNGGAPGDQNAILTQEP